MNFFNTGFIGVFIAGMATSLGALPVFFTKEVKDEIMDIVLGFAAGVMLSATAFSLLMPAINLCEHNLSSMLFVAFGVLLGGVFMDIIDKNIPHFHIRGGFEGRESRLSKLFLFILAIAIHNFPEGLAVGVSFGSGSIRDGIAVAVGIGLQNIPEGFAVAFPLVTEGISKKKAFFITFITGLVEVIGGIIGLLIIRASNIILPFSLAFAAGTMLFVISDEIIPETHRNKNYRKATYGVIAGFVVMMLFDTLLS